jgi:predicted acyltransferase
LPFTPPIPDSHRSSPNVANVVPYITLYAVTKWAYVVDIAKKLWCLSYIIRQKR